jgi:formylglycine-generating enzyme required for sulfatase activity
MLSPNTWVRLLVLSGLLVVLAFAVPDPTKTPAQGGKKLPKEITNSIGMKLVLIPAGKFKMGSPKAEQADVLKTITDKELRPVVTDWLKAESPQHEVEITRPFYLGVYEVTQKQYRTVMGKNPSWFSLARGGKVKLQGVDSTDDFPVESVSWDDAQAFLKKLSALQQEKAQRRRYRLPTEAEWEYACRGGAAGSTAFHYGNSLSSRQANFEGNYPHGGAAKGPNLERTCKVGSYKPNAWGLYDMHGNVYEWCEDWFDEVYYASKPRRDPPGPLEGSDRVLRGGSWGDDGWVCRSAYRWRSGPKSGDASKGFRAILVPPDR